jgi:hypothetical protein
MIKQVLNEGLNQVHTVAFTVCSSPTVISLQVRDDDFMIIGEQIP